jgi:hypothetical protein
MDKGKLLLQLLFIPFCCLFLKAQGTERKADCQKQYAGSELAEPKESQCWQKIEFKEFNFLVPSELKKNTGWKYDSGYEGYRSDDLSLSIEFGLLAGGGGGSYGAVNYNEKAIIFDGENVWMWSYETPSETYEYKYHAGALFKYNYPKGVNENSFTIRLSSKSTNIKSLAEKIFMSVKFVAPKPVPEKPKPISEVNGKRSKKPRAKSPKNRKS